MRLFALALLLCAGPAFAAGTFDQSVGQVMGKIREAMRTTPVAKTDDGRAGFIQRSGLCEGKAILMPENPWEPEMGIQLHFRAKSYLERLPSGQLRLTYDFVTYPREDSYDEVLRLPGIFLVEWKTIRSKRIEEDTREYWENPLFFTLEGVPDDEFREQYEKVESAKNRFMKIWGTQYFSASIFPEREVSLKDDEGSDIVVYDRNLKERARFHCGALVEAPAD